MIESITLKEKAGYVKITFTNQAAKDAVYYVLQLVGFEDAPGKRSFKTEEHRERGRKNKKSIYIHYSKE